MSAFFAFVLFRLFFFFFHYASISDTLNGSAHIETDISYQHEHTFLNLFRV